MPPACPPRSNRQSQPENARTSEEGEEEHEGRKGEKMRTCARLPAVLPSKSYIDRTPPPNGQPSTAPGQQAPQPAPAEAPSLPTYSRPFLSLSILLLESLQNPGLFLPVSRRTTAPRPPTWTPPAPRCESLVSGSYSVLWRDFSPTRTWALCIFSTCNALKLYMAVAANKVTDEGGLNRES